MGPLIEPGGSEIIGIGHDLARFWLGFLEPKAQAVPLGISDGFFFRGKTQADLAQHIIRGGPAHEWLNPARRLRFEFQDPVLRPCRA